VKGFRCLKSQNLLIQEFEYLIGKEHAELVSIEQIFCKINSIFWTFQLSKCIEKAGTVKRSISFLIANPNDMHIMTTEELWTKCGCTPEITID
jgi:hypothetical protein